MNRTRTSKIWSLPEEEFITLIKNSERFADVFAFFGLRNKGGNSKTLKARISHLNLDTSHFLGRIESSNKKRELTKDLFLSDWLVENSNRNRSCIKKYLLKFSLMDYSCNKCKNEGIWNGEKLALQLEHMNGVSDDNRLHNLCFLCPNCHSQTPTFAGRNKTVAEDKGIEPI